MPQYALHAASRTRAAHTFVELLIASVAGSMLLAGLASTMYIARQVAYSPVHAQRLLHSTTTALDLAEELKHAIHIVDYGATFIEFVTDDRSGDGIEETYRYEWSGVAGEPLRKALNRGTPVDILDSVHELRLSYMLEAGEQALDVTSAGSELQLPPSYTYSSYVQLQSSQHLAHPIDLSALSGSAVSWSLAGISYYARADSGDNNESPGEFALQLCRATANGQPTSEVLYEWIVPESTLSGWKWNFASPPSPAAGLSPHEDYCVVFRWRNGSVAARLGVDGAHSGMFQSADGGATWQSSAPGALMVKVHALPRSADSPLPFSPDRLAIAHISLQGSDSELSRIDTSVKLQNSPPIVEKVWQLNCDGNPLTQDRNGDGAGDFLWSGGATFDMSTLRDGVWQVSGSLRADYPAHVTTPVVVELRGESIGTGGNGLTARSILPRNSGEYLDVTASLVLQPDGTQTARLLANDGYSLQVLTTAKQLPARPLDLRVVIEPLRGLAALQVSGVDYPVVEVPVVSYGVGSASFIATEDSSHAEYEFVSFQITAP